MVYPALLPPMRTARLPVVDWADALADLNGLARLAKRRDMVSVRVPSHFNWPLPVYRSKILCNIPEEKKESSAMWKTSKSLVVLIIITSCQLSTVCNHRCPRFDERTDHHLFPADTPTCRWLGCVQQKSAVCQECRLRLKCVGARAETTFSLSAKWTSPFNSDGVFSSVYYWQSMCAHQRY